MRQPITRHLHQIRKVQSMRNYTLFVFTAILLLTGCQKEQATLELSDEDLLSTLEANLRTDDGGVILDVQGAVGVIGSAMFPCNWTTETTYKKNNAIFNLNQQVTWKVICVEQVPDKIVYSQTGSWQLNRLFLQAASNTQSTLYITQLTNTENYLVNGDVLREGQNILTRPTFSREFAHSFSLTFQHVAIRKSNQTIASGKAVFQIAGEVKDGKPFSEEGDIVFHGDQTATIHFKGKSLIFSWM